MRKNGRKILAFLFGAYGLLMLWLLFDRGGSQEEVTYWQQVRDNLNLEPFHTIGNYWDVLTNREYYIEKWEAAAIYRYHARHAFINLAGNVIMFVPLGFFLPGVFLRMRAWWKTVLTSAGIVVAVEILQLFTLLGSCDIDDFILNLLGVMLGFGIWKIGASIINKQACP